MTECANTMKKEDFRQSYNTYWIVSSPSFMSSITQDMKYCQSLRSYDPKHGVDRADCKAIKASSISASGVPVALIHCSPISASPDVFIVTPQHTGKNSSLLQICADKIPSWES